ncbi:MAG: 2Fe-2S iron-sulfur cluster binding domain-containing protein [Synergistaceae bacterium]|jgi:NADP-reducing hydrogenase subunit HndD|nr:2Fe-2S iron-sulfur cluster binding domain-containing protein [Synergistaceae bacterium]
MDFVNVTIDGVSVSVPSTYTVIEAAAKAGIRIPQLCYHPELTTFGACRVCLVEIEGSRSLGAACVYPVADKMVVHTNTPKVRATRKTVVELLLANHPQDCLKCQLNKNCELQTIAADLGIREIPYQGEMRNAKMDISNAALVREPNKCILCGRCARICSEYQGLDVYAYVNRGFKTLVEPAFGLDLGDVTCTLCGQCSTVCPTASIVEKDDTEKVFSALGDKNKYTIVQTAPSVRVALGEALGLPAGEIVTGKMVAALRRLGFDKVFDTDFSADLTIMEEGHEFLHRVQNGGVLPMITSCSPGWINFIEMKYPDLLPHLSSAKSPQGMFGAITKTFWPETQNVPLENIYSVSVMPCTAKKAECLRPQLQSNPGVPDVDAVITTRELARMIKSAGIDFKNLPEEDYDNPLGESSGAGVIFGVTGGVMEAALRTVYAVLNEGKDIPGIIYAPVRGMDGIKEATIDVPIDGKNVTVKLAVAHTLKKARVLMDKVRAGTADYHFIEVMACPGGCIGGGGQPVPVNKDIRAARTAAIYREDEGKTLRQSHKNPDIIALYDKWLGKPLGEKAHKYLHTHYEEQKKQA